MSNVLKYLKLEEKYFVRFCVAAVRPKASPCSLSLLIPHPGHVSGLNCLFQLHKPSNFCLIAENLVIPKQHTDYGPIPPASLFPSPLASASNLVSVSFCLCHVIVPSLLSPSPSFSCFLSLFPCVLVHLCRRGITESDVFQWDVLERSASQARVTPTMRLLKSQVAPAETQPTAELTSWHQSRLISVNVWIRSESSKTSPLKETQSLQNVFTSVWQRPLVAWGH